MTREPVLLVSIAKAIIVLLIAFNVHITGPQQDAIIGVVGIIATLGIGAWIERMLVTPIAAPVLPVGTVVTTPDDTRATVVGG